MAETKSFESQGNLMLRTGSTSSSCANSEQHEMNTEYVERQPYYYNNQTSVYGFDMVKRWLISHWNATSVHAQGPWVKLYTKPGSWIYPRDSVDEPLQVANFQCSAWHCTLIALFVSCSTELVGNEWRLNLHSSGLYLETWLGPLRSLSILFVISFCIIFAANEESFLIRVSGRSSPGPWLFKPSMLVFSCDAPQVMIV